MAKKSNRPVLWAGKAYIKATISQLKSALGDPTKNNGEAFYWDFCNANVVFRVYGKADKFTVLSSKSQNHACKIRNLITEAIKSGKMLIQLTNQPK